MIDERINVIVPVDDELRSICREILEQGWALSDWSDHESDDWFQSHRYHGGFDATEQQFCFSFTNDSGAEIWFQFPLEDVESLENGSISTIAGRLPD